MMLETGCIKYVTIEEPALPQAPWLLYADNTSDSDVNWYSGVKATYKNQPACEICDKKLLGKCLFVDTGILKKFIVFFCCNKCYQVYQLIE